MVSKITNEDVKLTTLLDDVDEYIIEDNKVVVTLLRNLSWVWEDEPLHKRIFLRIGFNTLIFILFIVMNGAYWFWTTKSGLKIWFRPSNKNFQELKRVKILSEI